MKRWDFVSKALLRRRCSSEASGVQSVSVSGKPFSEVPTNHILPRVQESPVSCTRTHYSSQQRTTWGTRARGYVIGLSSFGLGGAATVGVLAAMPNRMPIVDLPDFLQGGMLTAISDKLPNVHVPKVLQGLAKEPSSGLAGASQAASAFPPSSAAPAPFPFGPHFIADAAATAAPAVVNITVSKAGLPVPQDHSGTGFIYSSDGCILTNAHVIADALPSSDLANGYSSSSTSCSNSSRSSDPNIGAIKDNSSKPIKIALQDGRIFQGSVLMFDRISDLAVIQIISSQPLPTVKLGTSKGIRAGEWVLALGSPLHLQNSVTAGIISCVDRKAADLGLPRVRTEYIQTDAAINKGNSGGPLVNLQGEVIGLACFKALSADGVSFAIPIDTAKDVIEQLQQRGRVIRPYIGIKMLQLTEHNAVQMRQQDAGFPEITQGILVPQVATGSPACKCGMREGDVITGFAGQSSNVSTNHLIRCLGQHVDKAMEVQVLRPGVGSVSLQVNVSEALQ
ncbi:TPA: hypothetical protein ACH3X2_005937 [Trebouxia sp. C0005]